MFTPTTGVNHVISLLTAKSFCDPVEGHHQMFRKGQYQSEPCSPFLSYSEYEWVQLTFIVQVDFWGIRGGRWGRKKWWGGESGRTNVFSIGCCINRSTETKWIRLFLIPLASENMGESEWEPIYHRRREWDVQIDRKSITEAEVHHGIICDDPRPRQVDKM